MLHGLSLILTRNAAQIPVYGHQRECFERQFVAVEAQKLKEVAHTPLTRVAGAVSRSAILAQMFQKKGQLLLGTAEWFGVARLEASVCLQKILNVFRPQA